ncbi:hypothetical protein [Paenibacillus sp.]|uniref:hypothetical protein n=1 Tax=Paenibacillus sp. TaxID=58172 RepID=UPI002D73A578|nr:hypothetical protein [Paenibacillus sp.]HZG55840.1 hypothetical protein [Paenibacillus sp.]
MAVPQPRKTVRRPFAPLIGLLLLLTLLVAGTMAYASTEPPLDWSTEGAPDLADKVRGMVADISLSTTINETELNSIVKSALYEERKLSANVEITGADVALAGDMLTLRTDVTVGGWLRLPVTHMLRLEWEKPDVKATHLSSALKDISLPVSFFPIGTIRVPLSFDERIPAEIDSVTFEENALRLTFRLINPFN